MDVHLGIVVRRMQSGREVSPTDEHYGPHHAAQVDGGVLYQVSDPWLLGAAVAGNYSRQGDLPPLNVHLDLLQDELADVQVDGLWIARKVRPYSAKDLDEFWHGFSCTLRRDRELEETLKAFAAAREARSEL